MYRIDMPASEDTAGQCRQYRNVGVYEVQSKVEALLMIFPNASVNVSLEKDANG